MLKKTFLSLALFAIVSTNSFAQDKKAAIKELFHLMKTDTLIDKTFSSIIPMMTQRIKAEHPGADQSKMNNLLKVTMDAAKEMTRKILDDDMVVFYDKYFTEQEINEFTNFYKTPAGQKMITVMPELQKEIMSAMMTKYMPEMQQKIMKAVGPIEPASPAKPAAPASPAKKPAPAKKKTN